MKSVARVLAWTVLCIMSSSAAWGADQSTASIYQMNMDIENQSGKTFKLSDMAGAPLIISMFYTSCDGACPLIINNIKALERRLTPDEKKKVRVLLVSFDPDTDKVDVLKATAKKHRIDESRWTMARMPASRVEDLAAVLGIKYKKLNARTINHTSVISIVGPDGQILKQTEQFAADVDELVAALKGASSSAKL